MTNRLTRWARSAGARRDAGTVPGPTPSGPLEPNIERGVPGPPTVPVWVGPPPLAAEPHPWPQPPPQSPEQAWPRPPISEPIPIGTAQPVPHPPVPHPPVPGPPPGLPERDPVPAPAVFDRPPPPLPSFIVVAPPPIWTLPDVVDHVLNEGLSELESWPQRLRAVSGAGWSVVSVLRASAPSRGSWLPDGRRAILEENRLQVAVMRLPESALDRRPGVPLLSRLRGLHDRLLPSARPFEARWHEMGGVPAVLDTLAGGAAFQLSAELTPDDGMLAYGSAPPTRADTLSNVGVPLAALARPAERGLEWATPPNWLWVEELQLYGPNVSAQVKLEPLPDASDLTSWTDLLLKRGPFLRDYRDVGERAVRVAGCDQARLYQFDWQPAASSRLLTTLVAGIAGGQGFSFVLEVPLHSGNTSVDPDRLLSWVSVAAA